MERREAWRMKKAIRFMSLLLLASLAAGLLVHAQGGLAELQVQKIVLEPPSAVTRGSEVQIYARIANTGARNAESFTVGLFYRALREGEPWVQAGTREEANLGPSQQDFLEVTFDLPTIDLPLGTYEVKIVADVSNQIPEVDELNNELVTTMTVAASTQGNPELQPIGLTFTQTGTSEMDPWQIAVTIENPGAYVLSSFDVIFLVNGEELSIPIDPATPFVPDTGSTLTVIGTLDPYGLGLPPGTYTITAIVDSEELVNEQDEGNNTITGSLTIQALELHPETLRFDRAIVRLNEEVRLTSRIANGGTGLAKNVQVDFYIGHLRIGTTQIGQLGAVPQDVTVTLDPAELGLLDAPKVYEISVIVDPANDLHESDEANNKLVRTLTILEAQPRNPEIHPESIELTPASPTERVSPNMTVTVSSVVINTGRSEAKAVDVGFFYRIKGGRLWHEFPCADGLACSGITLAPGEQKRLVGTLSLGQLSPGIYEIRVATDVDGRISELDETNNELVTTLTVLDSRLPDLTIAMAPIEPSSSLQKGQTARLSVTVSNEGEESAEPTLLLVTRCKLVESGVQIPGQQPSCSDGYQPIDVIQVPALGIGESMTLRVDVETTDMSPGQYRLQAEVNPNGIVVERSETNNAVTSGLMVLGADLAPLPATLQANPAGTIDQTVVNEVRFSVTIVNAGQLAAGAFDVIFALSRVEDGFTVPVLTRSCQDAGDECTGLPFFGRVPISGIGAGAQLGVSCVLDLRSEDLDPGQYIVRVYVDRILLDMNVSIDPGLIPEHAELNNVAEIALVVVGDPTTTGWRPDGTGEGADLSAEWVSVRAYTDRIVVYGLIKNVGTEVSPGFDAVFTALLPNGVELSGKSPVPPLRPGEVDGVEGFNSVVFRLGLTEGFDDPLPVGASVAVKLEIPLVDAKTSNNLAENRTTVRD
jgi:subtilase family serine protease